MELQLDRNVKLRDLNEHITCFVCGGYLIEATTIVDCLHTFCKSCLIKRLLSKNYDCPKCGNQIHHSHPLQYIGYDRTLQDVVNKLVPSLQRLETAREEKFYHERGLDCPRKDVVAIKTENLTSPEDRGKSQNYHRHDEQIQISLVRGSDKLKTLEKPFMICSVNATIKILKKFVAKNIGITSELDILCNEEILGRDHSLKFVLVTRWRSKAQPLLLEYRPRVTLL
ncbi:polycomb group RING finger protein 3-like [Styela clava]|uniref:polycomb group RING finger protein 3-like n=1 Tax=Styela clava TaxID=7725 RepID=UPI001939B950|nr:polycomb group RING finger protein 3-like [Styela clava]XP_039256001.1 polycomb group RING finger protein 3-like [Styela clava]XP_039256054.1 polycomb group RING finger protein 3-like [Styela clava]